jgi:hypothetical protein
MRKFVTVVFDTSGKAFDGLHELGISIGKVTSCTAQRSCTAIICRSDLGFYNC